MSLKWFIYYDKDNKYFLIILINITNELRIYPPFEFTHLFMIKNNWDFI